MAKGGAGPGQRQAGATQFQQCSHVEVLVLVPDFFFFNVSEEAGNLDFCLKTQSCQKHLLTPCNPDGGQIWLQGCQV